MADKSLDSWDVEVEGIKLVEAIEDRSEELLEILEDFKSIYNEIVDRNAVFARAFTFAYELVEEKALDFLLNNIKKALINSVEFNYPLFINHLLQAVVIGYNEGGMISIIIDSDNQEVVGVRVDMSNLGSVEEYADAVIAARDALKIGTISTRFADVRSKIWREKIYGVAREGVRVFREYYEKGKRSTIVKLKDDELNFDDSSGEIVDVTHKYEGLYDRTIQMRLDILGPNRAPYWEIINYGSIGFLRDIGGTPYPANIPESNFVHGTEIALENAVIDAFRQYKEDAKNFIANAVVSDYDLDEGIDDIDDLPRGMSKHIVDIMTTDEVYHPVELPGSSVEEIIRTDRGYVKYIVSGGTRKKVEARDRYGKYARESDILCK